MNLVIEVGHDSGLLCSTLYAEVCSCRDADSTSFTEFGSLSCGCNFVLISTTVAGVFGFSEKAMELWRFGVACRAIPQLKSCHFV